MSDRFSPAGDPGSAARAAARAAARDGTADTAGVPKTAPVANENSVDPAPALTVPALTVLASGSGTTFQAVADAVAAGDIPCRINLLVVDRPGTGAAQRAAAAGVPVKLADRTKHRGRALSTELDRIIPRETKLVLLAGFLSIITEPLLTRFHRRMINLHPSLLPEFGGDGMYGRRVHEAVIAAGRTETGCTVHYVDAGTDTGEILLHRRMPILPEDTPDSLARRMRPIEHRAVIEALMTLLPNLR